MSRDVLYDMPVSNHGARVRILAQEKGIDLDVRLPSEIGGLKSPEFIALNAQGKMPLLVTQEGFPIPESDTICR
jgi:glutathione S-transferase